MSAALLHVKRHHGVVEPFVADECRVAGDRIEATGRWRYLSGRLSDVREYSWPSSRVVELRWDREEPAA